jgi:16S rRNA processing protein RimM
VPQEPREGFTAIGRVIRPHGLKGEVRVFSFNPAAPNLVPGARVHIGERTYELGEVRDTRDAWIVELRGLRDRDDVEELRGQLVEVPDEAIQPEEGAYFLHDLIGLRVLLPDGSELGTITEVLQPGANDVYVVKGPGGEYLIPAIGDVVGEIDLAAGTVGITPLPGMLNEIE